MEEKNGQDKPKTLKVGGPVDSWRRRREWVDF